ncbi:MAG: hypothetical protein HY074_13635 [Deltaproteobacteria bacterium]|nr:hypothetical protein [Deltaproteobacteria bacterium]
MSFLGEVAQAISRTSEDTQLIGDSTSVRAKYLLVGAILVPLLLLFVPLMVVEINNWDTGKPAISLSPQAWRAVYSASPESCDEVVLETAGCLANPGNPKLWTSVDSRADRGHAARVRALQGKEFWLGTTIDSQLLYQARKQETNQFILGYISASYRIWLDGAFLLEGNYANSHLPTVLTIPMERLQDSKPLKIALQIIHDVGSPVPDLLGGPMGEGFSNVQQARYYTYKVLFWNETRPWFFFGANLLIAILFLFFWSATRKKQEYFYMALYALVHALIQIRSIDTVYRSLGYNMSAMLEVVLTTYEGAFGMFLGLSFARSRRAFFQWGLPLCLVLPWPILFLLHDPSSRLLFTQLMSRWVSPLMYAIGAGVCAIQATFLFSFQRKAPYLGVRIRRLLAFGLGLAALTLLYFAQASGLAQVTQYAVLYRFLHFGLVLFLCAIVVREYREQELLIEKTPVSEFHRRAVLPDKISGAVLVVDLKRAAELFRLGARLGDSGKLVNMCLSHLWTAVSNHGGFVLQTEGDQMRAFFPREHSPLPLAQALRAAGEMHAKLALVEQQFREQNLLASTESRLIFRGGLVEGELRPVWHNTGGVRHPAWAGVGDVCAMTEATRLMNLERQVPQAERETNVLVPESLAEQAPLQTPEFKDNWSLRHQDLAGKHDKRLQVAVYRPRSWSSSPNLKNSA